jgi:putative transposase
VTDVVNDKTVELDVPVGPSLRDATDEQLVQQLADRARAEGPWLTGEGGLLGQLTQRVVGSALDGEMDDHLGYGKHEPAGRDGGNSRNGKRAKTLLTEAGPVGSRFPGTASAVSSRSWCASVNGAR